MYQICTYVCIYISCIRGMFLSWTTVYHHHLTLQDPQRAIFPEVPVASSGGAMVGGPGPSAPWCFSHPRKPTESLLRYKRLTTQMGTNQHQWFCLYGWLMKEWLFFVRFFWESCVSNFPAPSKSWCTQLKYWMCFPTPHSSIRYFFGSTRGPRIQLAFLKVEM